ARRAAPRRYPLTPTMPTRTPMTSSWRATMVTAARRRGNPEAAILSGRRARRPVAFTAGHHARARHADRALPSPLRPSSRDEPPPPGGTAGGRQGPGLALGHGPHHRPEGRLHHL